MGQTQACSRDDARVRLKHARKFLDVASLLAEPDHSLEYAGVAAALAVLAGIAATDAACCTALDRRSRSQGHRHADLLVSQVEPDGREAGKALGRLLNVKDQAHYGLLDVERTGLKAALRHANALVTFASEVLRR